MAAPMGHLTIKFNSIKFSSLGLLLKVSFFAVPYFIENDKLSEKLHNFRVIQKGPWTCKTYQEYPSIENGIVFTRIEMRHQQ